MSQRSAVRLESMTMLNVNDSEIQQWSANVDVRGSAVWCVWEELYRRAEIPAVTQQLSPLLCSVHALGIEHNDKPTI